MKRLFALLLLAASAATAQQQHPNVEQGVKPGKVYQFSDLDTVNLFNGNLMVHLPIGQAYQVGPSLKYQFMLSYNGKVWDHDGWTYIGGSGSFTYSDYRIDAYPNRRSNAGVGWLMSLGELVSFGAAVTYFDPTGAVVSFHQSVYENLGSGGTVQSVWYSDDDRQLRMKVLGNGTKELDFPDGEVHTFNSAGRLTDASDPYGNFYHVDYTINAQGLVDAWTITDSTSPNGSNPRRIQTVTFGDHGNITLNNYKRLVDTVVLRAFTGNSSTAVTSTYQFHYEDHSISRLDMNDIGTGVGQCLNSDCNCNITVPFLTSIDLPDGSTFTFTYHWPESICGVAGPSDNKLSGLIQSMTLPTGGTRSWDWADEWSIPTSRCNPQFLNNSPGIRGKSDSPGPSNAWTFTPPTINGSQQVLTDCDNPPPNVPPQRHEMLWKELRVDVLSPSGRKTTNYFSIWPGPAPSSDGFNVENFGLPFTSAVMNGGRYLSRQEYAPDGNGGWKLQQSQYVTYEGMPDAPRVKGQRTVFEENVTGGTIQKFIDEDLADNDGYGHYRTSTTTSDFGGSLETLRTVVTRYNPGSPADRVVNGALYIDHNSPWILGKFDRTVTVQGTSNTITDACFDTTGFLTGRRGYKNPGTCTISCWESNSWSASPQSTDVVTSYVRTSAGFLDNEQWFGGDRVPLPSGYSNICGAPAATPDYRIDYTYDAAVLATSRYNGFSWLTADRSIDKQTGLTWKSRDSSLVESIFSYDTSGRLTGLSSPGRAGSGYIYTRAMNGNGPSFQAVQCAAGAITCATPLMDSRYYYDFFGRLVMAKTFMPDGTWSTIKNQYDSAGRQTATAAPVSRASSDYEPAFSPTYWTTTDFDTFDRPVKVTNPDTSSVDLGYNGGRWKTHTSKIWNGAQDTPVTVTERTDGLGRLVEVTEPSGPTSAASPAGAPITTSYSYDSANHLTAVKMPGASGPTQFRLFDYDGRGFLRWESQPESGIASYEYDARGHLTGKTQSAANSLFDLQYTYDRAERPTLITGRNPFYDPANPAQPLFRPLKEFTYENTANATGDLRLGKLTRATRHNYGEVVTESDFEVSDAFVYGDTAGRKTSRVTSITEISGGVGGTRWPVRDVTTSVDYNDLDLIAKMKYPGCVPCGLPGNDPDRYGMTWTYSAGRLKSLSGFVGDISYWPNGMRNVLQHSNGIADTQIVSNMPRPDQIGFATYDRCVRPTFTVQPAGGQASSGGVTLSVSVAGTGPFNYEWRNAATFELIGNTSSIAVNPTATTEYYVDVTGACGHERSQTAKVTPSGCADPSTGPIQAILQPDGTWILKPSPEARTGRGFAWTHPPDTNTIATTETLTVGILTATTTYELTVHDSCGDGHGSVTITVPLPITNGMHADWVPTQSRIDVTWPAISGATGYTVERRSGATWQTIATSVSSPYHDTNVVFGRTYAYHVISNNGGSTNSDIATTMSFAPAVSQQSISAAPIFDMLTAVNKVRAAVGWPDLSWSNILAANDPLPAPGVLISSRHVLSCRARMNEALQALGIQVLPYSNPELSGNLIYANDINEVQQRAQ